MADVIHNPDAQKALMWFDWQAQWGSVHINSFADGAGDPGSPATSTGQVPCKNYGPGASNICSTMALNPALNAYPPTFQVSTGSFPTPVPITIGTKSVLTNAIKYDIKNSVVNCMSRAVPNWAILRGGPSTAYPYQQSVCNALTPVAGLTLNPNFDQGAPTPANYKPTLLYFPFYDGRTNDLQSIDSGLKPGCMQQVTNTCGSQSNKFFIRDIHDCFNTDAPRFPAGCAPGTQCDEPGFTHPVTHLFTQQELDDLGITAGAGLPSVYFSYDKKTGGGSHRVALSLTDPSFNNDIYTGSGAAPMRMINNVSDPTLARLQSFNLNVQEFGSDGSQSFVIMDPSDFFDLNLYTAGGKYDSGYPKKNGLVETPDTCPVMGITGYGGICDPTGNAGCNLPIYGIGPTTTFTDAEGNSSTYSPATVKWSGYVKSWAILSKSHFMSEIKGREEIYLTDDLLNENPIMRITRSLDYCDGPELTSAAHLALPAPQNTPDLTTCTQYMQYQQTDVEKNIYRWVDLYFPPPDQDPQLSQARIDVLYTNNFKKDGTLGSAVSGTGDNRYMPGYDPKNPQPGFVSFLDDKSASGDTSIQYKDANGDQHDAVVHAPTVTTKESFPTIGQVQLDGNGNPMYMTDSSGKTLYGADGKPIPVGVTYSVDRGTKSAIRMHNPITLNGKATTCAFLDAGAPTPNDGMMHPPKIFVPTNSQSEMQHFIDALSVGSGTAAGGLPVNGVTIRDCTTKFAPNTADGRPVLADKSNVRPDAKGTTWWGKVSCQELIGANQPSCNQTKPVSLERMCQYENGMFGDCEACSGVPEPDGAGMSSTYAMWNKWWQTGEQASDTDIMVAPQASGSKGDRCRFIANCFAISAANGGCPSDGTVGGHVFCLSGDTKITMADGSQKEIKKVKAGEKVMSFNAKNSRNAALETARITPLHKVVLANGRAVEAQEIKVGDKILKDNGMVEVVTKVQTNLEPITVYNLVLENGSDGYIAGGVRVMSYPTPKGMDVAKTKGAARNVSSVKH